MPKIKQTTRGLNMNEPQTLKSYKELWGCPQNLKLIPFLVEVALYAMSLENGTKAS